MKHQGFTLPELLISLGIIGVAAALIAPAVGNIMPNKDKGIILNATKTISEISETLLNNEGIYYEKDNCLGLGCQEVPLVGEHKDDNNYSGKGKFSKLLADSLNTEENPDTSGNTITLKTIDGTYWEIEPTDVGGAIITIDIDGKKGKNCSYSNSCKKPDQYQFVVDQFGTLHPHDPLTAAYMENPLQNNKKEDLKNAENIEKEGLKDYTEETLVKATSRS